MYLLIYTIITTDHQQPLLPGASRLTDAASLAASTDQQRKKKRRQKKGQKQKQRILYVGGNAYYNEREHEYMVLAYKNKAVITTTKLEYMSLSY
jgi:hypothetical protein